MTATGQRARDTARFSDQLRKRAGAARIAEDVDSADLSGVARAKSHGPHLTKR
jgi:hypothetical protein